MSPVRAMAGRRWWATRSQIARQVLDALVAEQIKVVFVTHLFDLSRGYHERHLPTVLFLRAQRGGEDARSYRLCEGEPLPTSYGADSYRKVFARSVDETPAGATDS